LGYEHGVESTHHDASRDGDTASAVRVGHNVAVADAQKRDGNQPHGVEQIGVLLVVIPATSPGMKFIAVAYVKSSETNAILSLYYVPFALTQSPAGDDPQRHHEDEKDGAWTNGHQRFQDESRVEVDAVESSDRSRRCVRK
jgi:hypothetical protein